MTAQVVAVRTHVVGPPEREPADTEAEWRWVQRCLVCDLELDLAGGFRPAGQVAVEYSSGATIGTHLQAGEEIRIAQAGATPRCQPEPIHPRMVIEGSV